MKQYRTKFFYDDSAGNAQKTVEKLSKEGYRVKHFETILRNEVGVGEYVMLYFIFEKEEGKIIVDN